MKSCPKCGGNYSDRRRVCSECRSDLHYFPVKVRERLTFEDGAVEVWSETEVEKLRAHGQTLLVLKPATECGAFHIPQHHVLSYDQLLYVLSAYKFIAARFNLQMLFRGQTRDYFGSTGDLIVLPAVARSETLHWDYQMNGGNFVDAFHCWEDVLGSRGVRTGSGIVLQHTFELRDGTKIPKNGYVNHVGAILGENAVVAAILQHYGFPTQHLDVTADLGVALWFALHEARTRDGHIGFKEVETATLSSKSKNRDPLQSAKVATLHVYLQPLEFIATSSLINLGDCNDLTTVAARPTRQAAWSIQCGRSYVSLGDSKLGLPPTYYQQAVTRPTPAAVFKIYFPFEEAERPELTAGHLFPGDEPLYRALQDAKVPYLAVYE